MFKYLAIASALLGITACNSGAKSDAQTSALTAAPIEKTNPHTPKPYIKIDHPEWARNAVIYQINTRQFTKMAHSH